MFVEWKYSRRARTHQSRSECCAYHTQPQGDAKVAEIKDIGVQKIVRSHTNIFDGLGKLKNGKVELIIDKNIKPVAQQQRRIPFHLQAKVDNELNRLLGEDIIERVLDTEATEWISPVVIVPKKNDNIRLCVDMRAANTARHGPIVLEKSQKVAR